MSFLFVSPVTNEGVGGRTITGSPPHNFQGFEGFGLIHIAQKAKKRKNKNGFKPKLPKSERRKKRKSGSNFRFSDENLVGLK